MRSLHSMLRSMLVFAAITTTSTSLLADYKPNWTRNTFPGWGNFANGYPLGTGMDHSPGTRSFFKVSPHPNKECEMIASDAMGATLVAFDGNKAQIFDGVDVPYFKPIDLPFLSYPWAATTAEFSKHNSDAFYILTGEYEAKSAPKNHRDTSTPNLWGLWKISGGGATFNHLDATPAGHYETKWRGKRTIMEDPHATRSTNIYYGSTSQGLRLSTDSGATWGSVDSKLDGRAIRTMAGGTNGTESIIYVIAGMHMPQHADGDDNPAYWGTNNSAYVKTGYTASWDFEEDLKNRADKSVTSLAHSATPIYLDEAMDLQHSLSFDGTDDYLDILDVQYSAPQDAITVAAWIRMDAGDTAGHTIVSYQRNDYWQLAVTPFSGSTAGEVVWEAADYDGTILQCKSSSVTVNDGKWHHIVGTYNYNSSDTDASLMKLFIDGVEVDHEPTTKQLGRHDAGSRAGHIGAWQTNGGTAWTNKRFKGEIDQLRIYDGLVSDHEIAGLARGFGYNFYTWNPSFVSQGELYRIDVTGTGTTVTELFEGIQDFVDIEVDPTDPTIAYVLRKPKSGNADCGGRELYKFSGSGTSGTFDNGGLPLTTAPSTSRFGSVNINPANANHIVMPTGRETDLTDTLVYSTDGGTNWSSTRKKLTAASGEEYVPSIESYNPTGSRTYDDGGAPLESLHAPNEPSDIGFLNGDASTVLWADVTFGLLKSTDYGATFKTHGAGGTNKDTYQIEVGPEGNKMIVGLLEAGYKVTSNGGAYWEETGHHTNEEIQNSRAASPVSYGKTHGFGVAINQENPNQVAVVHSASEHAMLSNDGGKTFLRVTFIDGSGNVVDIDGEPHDATAKNARFASVGGKRAYWPSNNHLYLGKTRLHNPSTKLTDAIAAGEFYIAYDEDNTAEVTKMNRLVVDVSAHDNRVLLGVSRPAAPENTSGWLLAISTDAGVSWTTLPDPVLESPDGSIIDGVNDFQIIGQRDIWNGEAAHFVAIDPNPDRCPLNGTGYTEPLRILLAGRQGIYEYTLADTTSAVGSGSWSILNTGIADSIHFDDTNRFDSQGNLLESDPSNGDVKWMGFVCFDPRPDYHHIVYAAKTMMDSKLGEWANRDINDRADQGRGTPYQPYYVSTDGGANWNNLHENLTAEDELPDYMNTFDINVDRQGVFYASTPYGIYKYHEYGFDSQTQIQNHATDKLLQATDTADETGGGNNIRCVNNTVSGVETQFNLIPVGDGIHHYVKSVATGQVIECMDVADELGTGGNAVRLSDPSSDQRQHWRKNYSLPGSETDPTVYSLQNRHHSSLHLQCTGANDQDTGVNDLASDSIDVGGAQIRAISNTGNWARWTDVDLHTRIQNFANNKMLQATATPDETGTGNNIRGVNNTILDESTQLYLIPVGDGIHYYIKSESTGLVLECLDVADEVGSGGNAVRLSDISSDERQQWKKNYSFPQKGEDVYSLQNRHHDNRNLQCMGTYDRDTGINDLATNSIDVGGVQVRAIGNTGDWSLWTDVSIP